MVFISRVGIVVVQESIGEYWKMNKEFTDWSGFSLYGKARDRFKMARDIDKYLV